MSKRSSSARWLAVALMAGVAAIGGPAFTSPAGAEDNRPQPGGSSGCTYAGQSYSEGSTRQQEVKQTNGGVRYERYKCEGGKWVYQGVDRQSPRGSVRPAPGDGVAERG